MTTETRNAEAAILESKAEDGKIRLDGFHYMQTSQLCWIGGSFITKRMLLAISSAEGFGCKELHLLHFRIRGDLELADAGTDGNPLPRLILEFCTLEGGLIASRAVLRGCELRHIELEKASSPASPCVSRSRRLEMERTIFLGKVEFSDLRFDDADEINFSQAVFKQSCILCDVRRSSPKGDCGIGRISFYSAEVATDLTFRGVQVQAARRVDEINTRAIYAESMHVAGDLAFLWTEPSNDRPAQGCVFHGMVFLFSARVDGQVQLIGVQVSAAQEDIEQYENRLQHRVMAIQATEIDVRGDLMVWPLEREGTSVQSNIRGTLRLDRAKIGAHCRICGVFSSAGKERAILARELTIGGDLDLGVSRISGISFTSDAELDFSLVTVGGDIRILNVDARVNRLYTPKKTRVPGERRSNEAALNFRHVRVKGDIALESVLPGVCSIAGIDLIASHVGGQFSMKGVTVWSPEHFRKAITAHGAQINGGVTVKPIYDNEQEIAMSSRIIGDFRMRNAIVKGAFVVKAGILTAHADSGVAFWGSNTSFDDVFLESVGHIPSTINGELRFRGARINGVLRLRGAVVAAMKSGCALDCFTAIVHRGIDITNVSLESDNTSNTTSACRITQIDGIVRLDSAETASLLIGPEPEAKDDDEGPAVHIRGALLLRDFQASTRVQVVRVLIEPISSIDDHYTRLAAESRLGKLSIRAKSLIVSARFAKLGRQFVVGLAENNTGLIDLFGAETGTLCGPGGENSDKWGRTPSQNNEGVRASIYDRNVNGVVINLDGFTYQRVQDSFQVRKTDPFTALGNKLSSLRLRDATLYLLGRPTKRLFGPRLSWLRRQSYITLIEDPTSQAVFISQPYRQLAKVFREQGYVRSANRLTIERRWQQIFNPGHHVHPVTAKLRAWFNPESYFGVFFGFGYSALRALFTVFLLLAGSSLLIHTARMAESGFWKLQAPSPTLVACSFESNVCKLVPRSVDLSKVCERNQCSLTRCVGDLCTPTLEESPDKLTRCSLNSPRFEALKFIMPFTRFQNNASCVLRPDASVWFSFWRLFLEIASWIVFPLAALTFSGLLREDR